MEKLLLQEESILVNIRRIESLLRDPLAKELSNPDIFHSLLKVERENLQRVVKEIEEKRTHYVRDMTFSLS